jgi:ATP synthase protein I
VIELVVGMLIGIAIGLALDYFLDTGPLFLIVFTLLGFIAGVKTMMNTAKSINEETTERKLFNE